MTCDKTKGVTQTRKQGLVTCHGFKMADKAHPSSDPSSNPSSNPCSNPGLDLEAVLVSSLFPSASLIFTAVKLFMK